MVSKLYSLSLYSFVNHGQFHHPYFPKSHYPFTKNKTLQKIHWHCQSIVPHKEQNSVTGKAVKAYPLWPYPAAHYCCFSCMLIKKMLAILCDLACIIALCKLLVHGFRIILYCGGGDVTRALHSFATTQCSHAEKRALVQLSCLTIL